MGLVALFIFYVFGYVRVLDLEECDTLLGLHASHS